MDSKGWSSLSTPINSMNQRAHSKHVGRTVGGSQKHQITLRKTTLRNNWIPKPINTNSGYQFEQSVSAFQKLNDLCSALREDNTKMHANETLDSLEKDLKDKEERSSTWHIDRDLFEKNDKNNIGDSKNNISPMRRRTLAPLPESQNALSHYTKTDTPRSRASSLKATDETFLHDTGLDDSSKISSAILMDSAADEDHKFSFENHSNFVKSQFQTSAWMPPKTTSIGVEMNYIMLIGLFAGVLVSKALQFLELYLCWFLRQILQLRNSLLGTTSIWEFLITEDNSRLNRHNKLFFIPLIILSCSLYALIFTLYFTVRFLLTTAPSGLINFVHQLYN